MRAARDTHSIAIAKLLVASRGEIAVRIVRAA
jgi:pyruvate carboxylase